MKKEINDLNKEIRILQNQKYEIKYGIKVYQKNQ